MSSILTKDELDQVISMRSRDEKITYEIGGLAIRIKQYFDEIRKCNDEKDLLMKDYYSLLERDKVLAKELSDKYGEGTINIDTGEIISNG